MRERESAGPNGATTRRKFAALFFSAVLVVLLFGSGGPAFAATTESAAGSQATFASPEAAVEAMLAALSTNDEEKLLEIFGQEHRDLIVVTDKVAATEDRKRVYEAAQEVWKLRDLGDGQFELLIGPDAWPMPIPIVKEEQVWRFDTAAGAEELINRRVGENELDAIETCRAYVDATSSAPRGWWRAPASRSSAGSVRRVVRPAGSRQP